MRHLFVISAAAILAACSGEMHHGSEGGHSHAGHQMDSGIVISSAYVMPPFPGKDVAGGFFEITNHGEDNRLISVSSPISETVEIHTHLNEDGVMKMRKIDGLDLPAGETITFKPGSYHLMMFGVDIPDGTEDVALTLNYETGEPITLIVPIGEPSEDDHSGH